MNARDWQSMRLKMYGPATTNIIISEDCKKLKESIDNFNKSIPTLDRGRRFTSDASERVLAREFEKNSRAERAHSRFPAKKKHIY